MDDLHLRRKWTLRAHGRQIIVAKRSIESTRHVLMKAFLWALHLPSYPDLTIEVNIGNRYKPDVISLDPEGHPRFWGESGHVGFEKVATIARKFRGTHFAIARWTPRLGQYAEQVAALMPDAARTAPFDVIAFPEDSAERFIDATGNVAISHADVEWARIEDGNTTLHPALK